MIRFAAARHPSFERIRFPENDTRVAIVDSDPSGTFAAPSSITVLVDGGIDTVRYDINFIP
jgi:hypothetical protein